MIPSTSTAMQNRKAASNAPARSVEDSAWDETSARVWSRGGRRDKHHDGNPER
ncbi:MAG: hypothetical protein ACYDHX_12525 [Methanothrix sp.]